ncbi:hypothetical protein D7004_17065 [Pedobacter jejuensis]|uniref:Uncharacterized protein n=1 Tax=Pedobacter jejuensis TaxID=1268550 RepID=A0A3N0BP48_9SPHI|nr:hypothetical protein D7004_17065 [Pedobacter jejuensis]
MSGRHCEEAFSTNKAISGQLDKTRYPVYHKRIKRKQKLNFSSSIYFLILLWFKNFKKISFQNHNEHPIKNTSNYPPCFMRWRISFRFSHHFFK